MQVYRPREFTGTRAWEALDIEHIADATVRLHWTDQPYIWHVNEGPEVFAVLDGIVEMRVRDRDGERSIRLEPGDVFHARSGDEHVAHPIGPARVLVIEQRGSI
jgi:mannose-6-phosphate isomerase-like protein (cupin superfamily)